MQSLPVQMHPRYNEFLAFVYGLKSDARKNPNALELAFDVWLKYQELNESFVDRPPHKTELLNENMILKAEIHAQKSMSTALRESNQELKKDLDRKHRECAEFQRQCAIQAEYISELVQDGAKVAKTENTSIQARIGGLSDVFMLASLVQFKYVQAISEPNEHNFRVGLAGGYEVFGKPEQYDKFIDKYLNWLESRYR